MKTLKATLIVALLFLTTNLCGCSFLMSPFTPFYANHVVSDQADLFRETPPQITVIESYQLATVNRIAIMPLECLFKDERLVSAPAYPKDWALSGIVFPPNDDIGRVVSEYIEEEFLKIQTVDVVERSRLKYIFQEQAILQEGFAEGPIPEIIGATAGAEAVLVGAIVGGGIYMPNKMPVKMSVFLPIKARLIDTRNGKILLTLSDTQSRISYNPSELYLVHSDISIRAASSISEAIASAREANPNAKPPEKAEFLTDNRIKY